MPVPEPPPVTCTLASGFFFMNSSAQRWTRMTIVSEPFTVTVPAFAARGSASRKTARNVERNFFMWVSPLEKALARSEPGTAG